MSQSGDTEAFVRSLLRSAGLAPDGETVTALTVQYEALPAEIGRLYEVPMARDDDPVVVFRAETQFADWDTFIPSAGGPRRAGRPSS